MSEELIKKLERISEKKKELDKFKPFPDDLVKNLEEWFRVELTYTSNAIEGNTLTRAETALAIEKNITAEGKTLNEHLEAVNHAEAVNFIKTIKDKSPREISEQDVLDIHRIILQKIDDNNAGRYRNAAVRIAGSRVILPNPAKVPELMEEFFKWLHSQIEKDSIKLSADAHFKLVSIHPFADGNGRTARLLMNLILIQNGYPMAIINNENRKEYINAVEKGQLEGDLEDFYGIIFESVEKSLDIYLDAVKQSI